MVQNPLRKSRPGKSKSTSLTAKDKLKQYGNLVSRRTVRKDLRSRRRAERMAGLPKGRVKRFIARLHPKRVAAYVFSKDGARQILKVTGIALAVFFLFVIAVFAYFRKDLPSDINAELAKIKQATRFYDRSGTHLLYQTSGQENRTIIKFEEMSPNIRNATVALEDKDFYRHGAFSFTGLGRAVMNNLQGKPVQGGSTITQQFVKNAFLSSERTYTRKVKELILSVELERQYSKDQILAFYLNQIPYGGPNEYGIESASKSFFKKHSSDLTLDEAAMLASIPQSPTYYSPYGDNTTELIEKRNRVLDLMAGEGYIKSEEAEAAKAVDTLAKVVPLEQKDGDASIDAPHFVKEVQKQLEAELGANTVLNGGLKVTTTLDWDKQQIAQEAVRNNIKTVERPRGGGSGDNVALVSEEVSTGQVLAYVGSRDYRHPGYGNFDAAQSLRQPGSSIKPIEYAKLFETGKWGPGSVMYDVPTDFGVYKPSNFDNKFRGAMSIRSALAESRNIPAIKSMYIVGQQSVIDFARNLGEKSFCADNCPQTGLSLAIGSGEMKLAEHTHAYRAFANGGIYQDQTYVLKVENPTGKVLKEWKEEDGERVMDEQIAYNITDILSDDAARAPTFGRNSREIVIPGVTAAVKTGTTNDARDGWMMGYSTDIVTGVWVGNHDNKSMNTTTNQQTGPVWTEYMRRVHEGRPNEDFVRPSGIKEVRIDNMTGYETDSGSNSHVDRFASFFTPKKAAGNSVKITIDSVSGKLATDCTPPRARQEVSGAGNIDAEIPASDPAYSRWLAGVRSRYPQAGGGGGSDGGAPAASDDVHQCSDAKPTVTLDVQDDGTMVANFSAGKFPITTIEFIVDGQIVSSQVASGNSASFYPAGLSGNHEFAVVVIDQGLYDATATQSESLGGVSFNISSPGNGSTIGSSITVDWPDYPDAQNYQLFFSGTSSCGGQCTANDSSRSVNSIGSGSHTVYVQAKKNGNVIATTPTITVTRN